MKRFRLLMAALFVGLSINAQQLTVSYTVKPDVNSPSFMSEVPMPKEYRSMIANAMKDFEMNFEFRYNNGESDIRFIPSEKKQTITIMGQTIDGDMLEKQYKNNMTYHNKAKDVSIDKMDLMGKVILIKDVFNADTFNVVNGEKKEILGYECKKAVSTDKAKSVWFTEYVPIPDGPVVGLNITGLVLEASDGSNIFTATKISETFNGTIVEPTEGEVMTKKGFKDYMKKMTEMLQRGGGF